MTVDHKTLQEKGWTIEDSSSLPVPNLFLPIRIEKKMAELWPRLDRGLRWIVLDLLRRYDEEVMRTGGDVDAPGWARMRLTRATDIILAAGNGEFQFRLMLPTKGRKAPAHIQISFVPTGSFSCWPEGLAPKITGKPKETTVEALIAQPIFLHPRQAARNNAPHHIAIDPMAERIIERIPDDIRSEVLRAVALCQVNFHLTNATGEAGAIHPVNFGVTCLNRKGVATIVPIGHVTDKIYFQNGWLMFKLAGFPAAFSARLSKGRPSRDILDITAEDGEHGQIKPFEGLEVSERMSGKTWMGPHVQIKMGHPA